LFYYGIALKIGNNVALYTAIFSLFSAGIFNASTGYLPSSFCMHVVMIVYWFWFQGQELLTVITSAIGVIYGWPFSGVLGIPIAFDYIFNRKGFFQGVWNFITYGLIALIILLPPCILIDYYYYHKITIVPLNILTYNVFSSGKGPELYGTEPLSYYLINGMLNFNIAFPLALISLPLLLLRMNDKAVMVSLFGVVGKARFFMQMLPMYIWFLIFFSQPHKEERFLSVVYPLICFHAAVSLIILAYWAKSISALLFDQKTTKLLTQIGVIFLPFFVFIALSTSRIYSIYNNYNAPMVIYKHLFWEELSQNSTHGIIDVCVGKEWYRFPSHFFFPDDDQVFLRFLKSDFAGQLPKYYEQGANATWIIPEHMNDLNLEEPSRYVDASECEYIVDQIILNQNEPDYRKFGFDAIRCEPFLDAKSSPVLSRAFYIPYYSYKANKFNDYCLLKRSK